MFDIFAACNQLNIYFPPNLSCLLHSLLGAAAVVFGLYVVLWGKAVESDKKKAIQDMAEVGQDIEEPLLRSDVSSEISGDSEPAC